MTLRKDAVIAGAIFVVFLSLYIYTAAPSIYDGDSGEIAAAVNTLGLAHPTGFPLYMLTGKLFTLLLPVGDVAYRLNIFSALLTASALALFFLLLRNVGIHALSSGVATVVFGMGGNTIWSNAGTVNVYAFSLFFVLALLYIYTLWEKTKSVRDLYRYAFLFGLSMGGHVLAVLMAVPFFIMLWQEFQANKRVAVLYRAVGLFCIPLLQYGYLWLAYQRNTVTTWGDMSSFGGFLHYITQRDFSGKIASRSMQGAVDFWQALGRLIGSEFGLFFFVSAVIGAVIFYRRKKALFLPIFLLALLNVLAMFFYGSSGDLFILQRYLFFVPVFLGVGLAFLCEEVFANAHFQRRGKSLLVITIICAFMIFNLKSAYTSNTKRGNSVAIDFAHNMFASAKPDSVLVVTGDIGAGSTWYLQSKGERSDISVVVGNLLVHDWYVRNMVMRHPNVMSSRLLTENSLNGRILKVIEDNIATRDVYTTFTSWEGDTAKNFVFVPVGVLNKVVSREGHLNDVLASNKGWTTYDLSGIQRANRKNVFFDLLAKQYLFSLNNTGMAYFRAGLSDEAEFLLRSALSIESVPAIKENLDRVLRHFSNINTMTKERPK